MPRAARTVAPLCITLLALLAVAPAASAHAAVAHFGEDLDAVACPSLTHCVAVDDVHAFSFDPVAPGHPRPHRIDAHDVLDVACPSSVQCTAVDVAGDEVTFRPGSTRPSRPVRVLAGTFAYAVACPASTQCTAVGDDGEEATFDPLDPGRPHGVDVDPDPDLTAIACPSSTECVIVGDDGEAIVIDPDDVTVPPAPIGLTGGRPLTAISCPASTECTATGLGDEVTFDPLAPATPHPTALPRARELEAIACPSSTECSAVTRVGADAAQPSFAELGVNPLAPGRPATALLAETLSSSATAGISCPSTVQCTTVFGSEAATFDPLSPGRVAPAVTVLGVRGRRVRLSCAGASACIGRITVSPGGFRSYRIPAGATREEPLATTARHGRARVTITVAAGATVTDIIR